MSAFSGKLPNQLQDFGLYMGFAMVAVALVSLFLHVSQQWRGARKVGPQDLIIVGLAGVALFAALAVIGLGWQYRSVPQVPTLDDFVNNDSNAASSKSEVLQPKKFLSKADKDRLSDALFELSAINSVELHQINNEVATVISPWLGNDPTLDATSAQLTIEKLNKLSVDLGRVNEKIYRDLYSRNQPYYDVLRSILTFDGDEANNPIVILRSSFYPTIEALNNYIAVYKEYSIAKPDSNLTKLIFPSVTEIRLGNEVFLQWIAKNKMNIINFKEGVIDGQE